MTPSDPSAAFTTLENLRRRDHPELARELLANIYEFEHAQQFEEDRGVIRAQLRDLISEQVESSS
jgi:hypothetical protein